jgi:hypothetical protein
MDRSFRAKDSRIAPIRLLIFRAELLAGSVRPNGHGSRKEVQMTLLEKRRFEMLVRLRAFCAEYPALLETAADSQSTLADLDAAIAKLRTHLQAQDVGLASFHEGARMRADARATLRRTLESIRTFAATLGTVGLDEKFRLPRRLSDATLVVRGRSFVDDVAPIADALVARGLPAATLSDLPKEIAALEQTMAACDTHRHVHVGARVGVKAALRSAATIVKRLDAMVLHSPACDAAMVAAWQNARRVGPSKAEIAAAAPAADQPAAPTNQSATKAA